MKFTIKKIAFLHKRLYKGRKRSAIKWRNHKILSPRTHLFKLFGAAIFQGARLQHVGACDDPRVFILKSILWDRQESKVLDTTTGEVFTLPWTELEFLDPVDVNLPGVPPGAGFLMEVNNGYSCLRYFNKIHLLRFKRQ